MPTVLQKDEAHKLIDRMPPNATWDGVNLIQAFMCNVGTCRSDVKGEIQVEDQQE